MGQRSSTLSTDYKQISNVSEQKENLIEEEDKPPDKPPDKYLDNKITYQAIQFKQIQAGINYLTIISGVH